MRQYALLVVLFALILLLYTLFPKPVTFFNEQEARDAVFKDVASLDAETRILSSTQNGSTWEFEVLVTTNAHTACPSIERRFYKLPPVSFRPEPFITGCYERSKLLYREEALITSAKKLGISEGYGCAFKAGASLTEEKKYCLNMNETAVSDFAVEIPPEAWIAYWDYHGQQRLIALDENAAVLKTA